MLIPAVSLDVNINNIPCIPTVETMPFARIFSVTNLVAYSFPHQQSMSYSVAYFYNQTLTHRTAHISNICTRAMASVKILESSFPFFGTKLFIAMPSVLVYLISSRMNNELN